MVLSSSCEVRRFDNSSTCGTKSKCHRTTPATTSNKLPILPEVGGFTSNYPSPKGFIVGFTMGIHGFTKWEALFATQQAEALTCAALSSEAICGSEA